MENLKVGMQVANRLEPTKLVGVITRITPIKTVGSNQIGGFIEIDNNLTGSSIFQNHYIPYLISK